MSQIRPEFRVNTVKQLADTIYFRRSSLYYFLGKIDQWNGTEDPPAAPNDAYINDVTIRDNILYMRRVTSGDISLATTAYYWESGTVYTQWDHTLVMVDQPFYVVTDDYNVYKCLCNNNGAQSTIKPTGSSTEVLDGLADGYIWKYMYNIPSFKRRKFLSRGRMPVQRALTDAFYNKGAVEEVVVEVEGSGYTNAQPTSIAVTATGTAPGTAAVLIPVVSNVTGQILEVKIINPGSLYEANPTLTVNQPITSSGTGKYLNNATAILKAFVDYETVNPADIVAGTAYKITTLGTTSWPSLGAGISPAVGTVFTATANGSTLGSGAGTGQAISGGQIVNVTIEDPGINYPADNSTTITVAGDGTGAAFSPVVYGGKVIDVVVDNAGEDYSYIDLQVTGTGAGAIVNAVLGASDFLSDQSIVEQTVVPGAIYAIVVTNGGTNYTENTVVSITGDGTGATATPVIVGGVITKIVMQTYGTGYTNATVSISDPTRYTGIAASAYATLPPTDGHGADANKELYADTLCIFTQVKDDEELVAFNQDYRQYGLLMNPGNITSNNRLTEETYFVTFVCVVDDATDMVVDEILTNENKDYRVVFKNGNIVTLQQLSHDFVQPTGEFVAKAAPGRTYTIQNITTVPEANKYSGELLYIQNAVPFIPTSETAVSIRTYIGL